MRQESIPYMVMGDPLRDLRMLQCEQLVCEVEKSVKDQCTFKLMMCKHDRAYMAVQLKIFIGKVDPQLMRVLYRRKTQHSIVENGAGTTDPEKSNDLQLLVKEVFELIKQGVSYGDLLEKNFLNRYEVTPEKFKTIFCRIEEKLAKQETSSVPFGQPGNNQSHAMAMQETKAVSMEGLTTGPSYSAAINQSHAIVMQETKAVSMEGLTTGPSYSAASAVFGSVTPGASQTSSYGFSPNKRGRQFWSAEEDEQLKEGLKQFEGDAWSKIAKRYFNTNQFSRTQHQLKDRARTLRKKNPGFLPFPLVPPQKSMSQVEDNSDY